ncbi:Uncharacterized protein Adt_29553 [Abeliophyllum distichum]|uniref:Uncharacterized protein n=1 Tax=Abeliophyllum distichum TaxID=126358 RepID=A0ABD1R8P5_9LAMI
MTKETSLILTLRNTISSLDFFSYQYTFLSSTGKDNFFEVANGTERKASYTYAVEVADGTEQKASYSSMCNSVEIARDDDVVFSKTNATQRPPEIVQDNEEKVPFTNDDLIASISRGHQAGPSSRSSRTTRVIPDVEDLHVDQLFDQKKDLQEAVHLIVLKHNFEFKYAWEHTCEYGTRHDDHKQARSWVIERHIMHKFPDPRTMYKPANIIHDIRREFRVVMSYQKAWKSKE